MWYVTERVEGGDVLKASLCGKVIQPWAPVRNANLYASRRGVPMVLRSLEVLNVLLVIQIRTAPWHTAPIESTAYQDWKLLANLKWQVDIGKDIASVRRGDLNVAQDSESGGLATKVISGVGHRLGTELQLSADRLQWFI